MSRSMVFHYPLSIMGEGVSGSQVRPFRMLKAFQDIGYECAVVAGAAADRRRAIQAIKRDAGKGRSFRFAYAESSTMPTLLTEPHHLPTYPNLDFGFFSWLRRRGVPLGLFYRDVHWRFEFYRQSVAWPKRMAALPFYWYDWLRYRRLVNFLFLPSEGMRHALPTPWPQHRLGALPPGCDPRPPSEQRRSGPSGKGLALLYVGGVRPPLYDVTPMLQAAAALNAVHLTLCCRAPEWQEVKHEYTPLSENSRLTVAHPHSGQLERYYLACDLFVMVRHLCSYQDFAMPVKLFEALGFGVPVVAGSGTEAGRFAEQTGVGWAVSDAGELCDLLTYLIDHPTELVKKRRRALAVREEHTWAARARAVAAALTGEGKGQ